MKHIYIFFLLAVLSGSVSAQDEQTVMTIFSRICQTDSIQDALRTYDQDSAVVFHFKTPDMDKYGILEYDFENFVIVFDTGSELLFAGKPFASIDVMNISNKKAEITLRLEGLGNRKTKGKFETSTYYFVNKNYKWLLKNIKYN